MGFLKKLLRRLTRRGKGSATEDEKDAGGGLQQAIGNRLTTKALQQQLVPKAWPQGTTGTRVQLSNEHSGEAEVGGDARLDAVWGKKTHYARTEQEQARYLMSTAQTPDKRTLLTGNDGSLLDTSKSSMPVGMSQEKGRNIFVMGADGKMRTLDVGSEFNRINPGTDLSDMKDAERVHHTTMLGGQDVLAAGEMEIDQGQLRMMSNRSGHYRPPAAALHQAASQLDRAGVEMGAVGMQVLGSGGEFERMHSKGMLSIPALQFLAHGKEMEDARQRASNPDISEFERKRILNEPMEAIQADRARNAGFFALAAAEARRRGLGDPENPSEEKDPEPTVAESAPQPAPQSETVFYNDPDEAPRTSAPPNETFYNLEEKDEAPHASAPPESFYNLEEKDDGQTPAPGPAQTPAPVTDAEELAEEIAELPPEEKAELADLYRVSPV